MGNLKSIRGLIHFLEALTHEFLNVTEINGNKHM